MTLARHWWCLLGMLVGCYGGVAGPQPEPPNNPHPTAGETDDMDGVQDGGVQSPAPDVHGGASGVPGVAGPPSDRDAGDPDFANSTRDDLIEQGLDPAIFFIGAVTGDDEDTDDLDAGSAPVTDSSGS